MRLCQHIVMAVVMTVLVLGVAAAQPGNAPEPVPSEQVPPDQRARYHALIEELRCLVCQNQNLAESNAELALDLKRQVVQRINAGQTDAQIKDYLQQRYGDFVLYRPPFKPQTWVLWIGPFVLLAVVIGVIVWRFRRRVGDQAPETTEAVDREALRRLLDP